MDPQLLHLVKNFNSLGKEFVIGTRNTIKLFEYNGKIISIKSFKKPNFFIGIIYKFFRSSKAKRSFLHAKILERKEIGTPKPIGFYENKSTLRLLDSYYICEHLEVDYVFKDIFEIVHEDLDSILKQLAEFTFKLHENGIEFLDHSPGNTLIKKNRDGKYNFFLVDLNRMKFHKNMTLKQRAKNFSRLTPSEYMIMIMSYHYATLINRNKEDVFELFWQGVQRFYVGASRKKRFKKRILFWKK